MEMEENIADFTVVDIETTQWIWQLKKQIEDV